MKLNKQLKFWSGNVNDYTARSPKNAFDYEKTWKQLYGVSYKKTLQEFFGSLPRSIRILDVGCGVGVPTEMLLKMGFSNITCIDINEDRLRKAQKKGPYCIKGVAQDLPFKDNCFDLVFVSVVLVHIAPKDITKALDEIYRCSKRYIFGYELYTKNGYKSIIWRNRKDLLWKTDFVRLYQKQFQNLCLRKFKIIKYLENENRDSVFLLEKTTKNTQN